MSLTFAHRRVLSKDLDNKIDELSIWDVGLFSCVCCYRDSVDLLTLQPLRY
jgi:hypothetical protein